MNSALKLSNRSLEINAEFLPVIGSAKQKLVAVLYRQHRAMLVALAAEKLGSKDAAEDVVQDAFVAILQGDFPWPSVDPIRTLRQVVLSLAVPRARHVRTQMGLRTAREHAEEAAWRARRIHLRGRPYDPRDDEEDEQ